MIMRFYDRPVLMFKNILDEHEKSDDYAFQFKVDGFLTHIFRDRSRSLVSSWRGSPLWGKGSDGSLFFVSRRSLKKGGPTLIPVSDKIIEAVEHLDLPDQTMFAGEWMSRRTDETECPEKIFLFDLMWLADEWQGDNILRTRSKRFIDLIEGKESSVLEYLRFQTRDFLKTYEMISTTPSMSYTEGLVLKHLDSLIKGNRNEGVDNGLIIRVKFRAGFTGREIVSI